MPSRLIRPTPWFGWDNTGTHLVTYVNQVMALSAKAEGRIHSVSQAVEIEHKCLMPNGRRTRRKCWASES